MVWQVNSTDFYPLIVGLGVALGYDAMFGFAIIAVGEFVGFMGATLNPYSVGIARTISGVELYSGTGYRAICFVIFMAISIIYVMVYGRKIKKNPGASVVFGEKNIHAFDRDELNEYSFTLKRWSGSSGCSCSAGCSYAGFDQMGMDFRSFVACSFLCL